MNNLTDQQKGSLLAFIAVIFITPDSLFIRLSNVDTWGLVFYRGIIPFFTVFLGMLIIYKLNFFKILLSSGFHGLIYVGTFSITNITFVVSIQNTNVANTLVMIATAPMLSAILGAIFLKEPPDKKTWISIIITFIAIIYIFSDSLRLEILNTGQLKFNEYGSNFDGAPNYFLGVNTSGLVLKTTGAGTLSNTWLQATDDRDMAPEGSTVKESVNNLKKITLAAKQKQLKSGIKFPSGHPL